jgi:predicted ATPase
MLKKLRIKNFKSWEDTGEMEIAPITMFFGGNSSGKSSILQFLLMLKQTRNSYDKEQILNFGGKENDIIDLGNFRDVIFNHEIDRVLEFRIDENFVVVSHFLNAKVIQKNDALSSEVVYQDLPFGHERLPFKMELPLATCLTGMSSLGSIEYLGPLRQAPQREYQWKNTSPSTVGKKGEYAIDAILAAKKGSSILEKKIATALQKMGLVDSFRVAQIPTTDLYQILIKKTLSSTEVLLPDVGFGVSQILPVLTSLFYTPVGSIIILEQPEIHLHPKAQTELADVVVEAVKERKIQVIIESHSEHFLTRIQTRIADGTLSKDAAKLYFCKNEIGKSELEELKIDDSGRIENWPKDFFGDMLGETSNRVRAYLDRKKTSKK